MTRTRFPCIPGLLVVAVVLVLSVPGIAPASSAQGGRFTPPPAGLSSPAASTQDALSQITLASVTQPAAGAPTWINVTHGGARGAPPPTSAMSIAYDPADHSTVLFGGCRSSDCPVAETWVFANGTWTNVTQPSQAPPAREWATLDFDANMGGLLLFGGLGVGGTLRNDTWLYQGGRWSNVTYVGGGPSPRYAAMMAFDPAPEENGSVLFGGCVPASLGVACSNDTWVWRGWAGWTRLAPAELPPAVGFGAMAYDPSEGYVLLYGGCAGTFCGGVSNSTWAFYSGQWWPLHSTGGPSARFGVDLGFDPARGQMLMFGGFNTTLVLQPDTWAFTAGNWRLLAAVGGPSARDAYGVALDPTGHTLLLFGGGTAASGANDTWAYEIPPSVTLAPGTAAAEVTAPVRFAATVTGGSGSFGVAVTFGDGDSAWAAGAGPVFTVSTRYSIVGDYTAAVNVTDSAGATASAAAPMIRIAPGPTLAARASLLQTDVGVPIAFTSNASTYAPSSLNYSWWYGDGATAYGNTTSHAYATPGTYGVWANVTDSAGGMASYALPVVVVADPTVALSAPATRPDTSTAVAWAPSVSEGTGPFHFAWSFGDGTTSAIPSPMHVYSVAATYTVTVWANDSVGESSHTTATVTVLTASAPTPSSSSTASPPLWFWGGVAALVAVAVVGSIVLARRGRSR